VARVNHAQGPVVFSPAGDNEWTDAALNRPLNRGDRLWTDRGSRAEIQVGSSAVRMDGKTHLEIRALDDQSAQLSVTQGTVYVRVRSLPEGEVFEIDTPNLAYRAAYPGDYRIDVDPALGTTRVTIHSGTGAVYGENGEALPLGGGQQITFRARSLAQVNAQESPPQDAFDRWAAERNRLEDQSVSARFVPREVVGYQHLDAHGQWSHDTTQGIVWIPQGTPADWAPYRHGHWEWISPWLDLIDDALGFRAVPLRPLGHGRFALGLGARTYRVAAHLCAGLGCLRRRQQRRRELEHPDRGRPRGRGLVSSGPQRSLAAGLSRQPGIHQQRQPQYRRAGQRGLCAPAPSGGAHRHFSGRFPSRAASGRRLAARGGQHSHQCPDRSAAPDARTQRRARSPAHHAFTRRAAGQRRDSTGDRQAGAGQRRRSHRAGPARKGSRAT
jgi:hypothetical protein